MHWKTKARIQKIISSLPTSSSNSVYYWLQRHFGKLKQPTPMSKLSSGIETWKRIEASGSNPKNGTFVEIGTGRVPLIPIAYWLMGANRVITFDLNRYLKEELLRENLAYLFRNHAAVQKLFGASIVAERFRHLKSRASSSDSASELLASCNIEYVAPGDARSTDLPDASIDFHTSRMVLEHIPPKDLEAIFTESRRILRNEGLLVHQIDYSDHFAHSDRTISKINFLKYSDADWSRYADNRFMYMNRLRHDDYLTLFGSLGYDIRDTAVEKDLPSRRALDAGFQIDRKFKSKSIETLATTSAWIVAKRG